MNSIIFKLTDFESISIFFHNNDFKKIDLYEDIKVFFINEKHLCIGEAGICTIFEVFIKRLKKAINNQLQLDASLTQNLGFMLNEKDQDKIGFVMVRTSDGSGVYWIGLNYKIWETYNDADSIFATWLYNDNDGNIIFEITPLYKWSFIRKNSNDPELMTYEEFMKDYKPLIRRIIPREIAVEWLDQAMQTYRKFYTSEELFQRAINRVN